MTRHTQIIAEKEYIKWYNIAKNIINDKSLIPDRTEDEIVKLVSRNNWLIFSRNINEDGKEARAKAEPNVFFELLTENGNFNGLGTLGLTFDKIEIVRKFATILHDANRKTKDALNQKLKSELKYDWELVVNRKIKSKIHSEKPDYKPVKRWNIKDFNENIIDNAVEIAEKIDSEGKSNKERILAERVLTNGSKYYSELPTINLIENKGFNLDEYDNRVSEIFDVLKLVLSVKGRSEIKKQKKDDDYLRLLKDKVIRYEENLDEESNEEDYKGWKDEIKRLEGEIL